MENIELFTRALEIPEPWHIERLEFKKVENTSELHIELSHDRGVKFEYEGSDCPVYDHQPRSWQHMNFFQHRCYIYCNVPRVMAPNGKVKLVSVPWAQKGSGFTLLFEAQLMNLVLGGMSVKTAGEHMGISDKRAFTIIDRNVSHALATQPLKQVRLLSIDETSRKKGQKYITVFADREEKKVVGLALGKDQKAAAKCLIEMEVRDACRTNVKNITMDMSKAYIAAARDLFSQAKIIFDRFHMRKKLNEAIDNIRREEQRRHTELKKSRYLWLKNECNLNIKQKARLDILLESFPTIGEAYRLKELYREVMNDAHQNHRLKPLNDWMKIAWESGIGHIQDFVNFLRDHWFGVKTYFATLATNAYAENVNLKIQDIRRTARGYKNMNNFMKMIYFHLGKLELFNTHYK
jgi:transposase